MTTSWPPRVRRRPPVRAHRVLLVALASVAFTVVLLISLIGLILPSV